MSKDENINISDEKSDVQSHPQRYQSTGSQYGSHVEPDKTKTKKNLNQIMSYKSNLVKFSFKTYITIVGRWNNILELLSSEDINSNEVTLRVTVLTSLRSRNLNNLSIKNKYQIKKRLCHP